MSETTADASSGPKHPSRPLQGLHVLVVDDNRDTREMLRQVLAYAGALVSTVADADSALGFLSNALADVVISDLSMPEHDGRWMVRGLRAMSDHHARIPAIAITAYRETEHETAALAAGFDAYLEKPLDFRRLVDTIARTVDRRRG
jgi:CheY-like chemotaxis protein